jgi:hypothetical protein
MTDVLRVEPDGPDMPLTDQPLTDQPPIALTNVSAVLILMQSVMCVSSH